MQRYLRLLRENPEYTKLWLAQVISLTGDWFNTIVLIGLVTQYSGNSALAISLYLTLRVLPPLLLGPFAGVLLDRFNRKNILMWSNILRAMIVPLYLLANSPETIWIIYAVTIAQFTLSTVFEPGQGAILPALVKPDDIVEGNTLFSVTWSVMLALGAILGGVFAFIFGAQAALVADAVTFAIAGALVWSIKYDPLKGRKLSKALEQEKPEEEDTSFLEGLRFVRNTPQMAATLFVKFGQSLGNVDTLLSVFATQIFVIGNNGELSQAILWSALGFGALIGPMLTNRVNDGSVAKMRRLINVGFVLLLGSWIIMGFANSLMIISLAIFVRAMGGSINWTYSNVIIQKTAPDAKLGRMFSIDTAGFYFATLLSTIAHGWLIDKLGNDYLVWIIAGTFLVGLIPASIWFWIVPKLEKMEATDASFATVVGD
ncbi:MAG: MFS transporter [Phototrophicaceae bacterium]